MRILYHFKMSAFSRRARLALAHKELPHELREGRSNAAWLEEAKRLHPLATMPVLVDGDHVIGDSGAITHYLDRAYPARPLWPTDADELARALRVTTLADGVLDTIVDLGTRYYALRADPAWKDITTDRLGRVDQALAQLESVASDNMYSASSSWSVADIWLASMVLWLNGLPKRAETPLIAQILSLGVRVPSGLTRWLDRHASREDIASLDK